MFIFCGGGGVIVVCFGVLVVGGGIVCVDWGCVSNCDGFQRSLADLTPDLAHCTPRGL